MENFNHFHILFSYPPKTRLSDLVANMKTVSSIPLLSLSEMAGTRIARIPAISAA